MDVDSLGPSQPKSSYMQEYRERLKRVERDRRRAHPAPHRARSWEIPPRAQAVLTALAVIGFIIVFWR